MNIFYEPINRKENYFCAQVDVATDQKISKDNKNINLWNTYVFTLVKIMRHMSIFDFIEKQIKFPAKNLSSLVSFILL